MDFVFSPFTFVLMNKSWQVTSPPRCAEWYKDQWKACFPSWKSLALQVRSSLWLTANVRCVWLCGPDARGYKVSGGFSSLCSCLHRSSLLFLGRGCCLNLFSLYLTLESRLFVTLEGEKVDVQWLANGELRDKDPEARRKDLEDERVYPSAGDFHDQH